MGHKNYVYERDSFSESVLNARNIRTYFAPIRFYLLKNVVLGFRKARFIGHAICTHTYRLTSQRFGFLHVSRTRFNTFRILLVPRRNVQIFVKRINDLQKCRSRPNQITLSTLPLHFPTLLTEYILYEYSVCWRTTMSID